VSTAIRARLKLFLKRAFLIGISSLVALTAMAYGIDYALFRYRVATHRQAFGQVTVHKLYAVQEKGGKVQFIFQPPEAETCVHALFPQGGYTPCWYLQRHTEQRTNI